ncbi:ROK family transcriptional regulator [Streptomyces sp. NA04227]|uniref:ROK family transcriptional regulator n=1 Tax=Streptomyces sp. NA04227 TaxID=2742136 RepID=UPI00159015FC|nr:ROK family transcriptional regulator [Streptomyces sp. NA04227]QKW07523.1 ROK family transcriptional regulator [Streptomyces sp. NA04227]
MKTSKVLPGGDQSALRHLNTSRVLQLLYEDGPLTINAISRVTGLSRPTVRGIVTALQDARLLRTDGQDSVATGGRPAQRYAFDRAAGCLAGLHIDADGMWLRLTDLGGGPLAAAHRALPEKAGREERLRAAADLVREHLAEQKAPLWAVGAGTPGIVDAQGTVRLSVPVPDWSGVRLAEELATRLECPVTAMKDTNLAALAEHRTGAAQGVQDLLYVQMSRRLGVGILVDGKPFTGRSGGAGEIGRHPGLGWEHTPERLFAASGSAHDDPQEAGALTFARARHGDAQAERAVAEYAGSLADGIGAMLLAVDPTAVVLGGSLAAPGGALVLEPIRQRLAEIAYEVPPVTLSALGEDAVAVGAVEAARDLVRGRMLTMTEQLLES